MKKYNWIFLFVFLFAVIGVQSANAQLAAGSYIKVLSPNGGETLEASKTYRITWQTSPNIDKVSVMYQLDDNATVGTICSNCANTGYFDWIVNVGYTTSIHQYKIKIIGYETNKGSVSDQSDNFFNLPLPPTPTITSVSYSPGSNGVSETFTVLGSNFSSGSKLQYTDTLDTTRTGELTYIISFSPTKIVFGGNLYTGNVASVYRIKVVNSLDRGHNEVIVDTRPKTVMPEVKILSPNGGELFTPRQFNYN